MVFGFSRKNCTPQSRGFLPILPWSSGICRNFPFNYLNHTGDAFFPSILYIPFVIPSKFYFTHLNSYWPPQQGDYGHFLENLPFYGCLKKLLETACDLWKSSLNYACFFSNNQLNSKKDWKIKSAIKYASKKKKNKKIK